MAQMSGGYLYFANGKEFIELALKKMRELLKSQLKGFRAEVESSEAVDDFSGLIMIRRNVVPGRTCEYMLELEPDNSSLSPISGGFSKIISFPLNGNFEIGRKGPNGNSIWMDYEDFDPSDKKSEFKGTRITEEKAKRIVNGAVDRIMRDMPSWR